MTRSYSAALPIAYVVLRVLMVLSWFYGAAILFLLAATVLAQQWTFAALGITLESGIPQRIMGLQGMAALGFAAVVLNYSILKRLLAMVGTVRAGDPFIPANAERLQAIAWILLALQLISLAIAAIARWISTAAQPVNVDAGFSISGWLAVLLAFVLARVFAEGTRMREDLEGTV